MVKMFGIYVDDEVKSIIELYDEHFDLQSDIQSRLLDIGTHLATPISNSSDRKIQRAEFSSVYTLKLEKIIDKSDLTLKPLHNFILPIGKFQMVRALVRNAERKIVPIVNKGDASKEILVYLNRLSSYYFVLGRWYSYYVEGENEIIYKKS